MEISQFKYKLRGKHSHFGNWMNFTIDSKNEINEKYDLF